MVRRHSAPVGVQAGLASGAIPDGYRYDLCRRGGRWVVSLKRRGTKLAGTPRPTRAWQRAFLATGRRWIVSAYDHFGSEPSGSDVHSHLGCGRVSHRRRWEELAADQPWTTLC